MSKAIILSIVTKIQSLVNASFEDGLNEIKALTHSGNESGLLAAREAIVLLSGKSNFKPYKPGPIMASGDYFEVRDALLDLAARKAFLDDPGETQRLISAFKFLNDQQDFSELVDDVIRVGGYGEARALLLLNMEMWCYVQLTRRHGKNI